MRKILLVGWLITLPLCCGKLAICPLTTTPLALQPKSSPTLAVSETPAQSPQATPTTIIAAPSLTPTIITATPTLTPTLPPTPTPTPAPLEFYLTAYEPACVSEGPLRLGVETLDEGGQLLDGVKIVFTPGQALTPTVSFTSGGAAEFALMEGQSDSWTVEIADESGGGLPVSGILAQLKDCPGRRSYDLRFQHGLSDPAPLPYTPIAFTPIGQREIPPGPWSPDQIRPLSAWPRPPYDNGRGIHSLPTGYYEDWVLDLLIKYMKEMHMTWTVVLYNDENMLRLAATKFRDAGIMVIWRPDIRPGQGYLYIERDMAILNEIGMPAYLQLYNEAEVATEWAHEGGQINLGEFARHWVKLADEVYRYGGFPGLQVVDPEGLMRVIDEIRAQGKEYLFNEMFFIPHPYGSNHPPAYPYDPNMQGREPGKTVDDDWFCVLGFLKYGHIFQEKLGFVPPMIAGEGGWTVKIQEDDKYPPVSFEQHRDWHVELFTWFRTGRLSNGEPLPDYLFAYCPWVIGSANYMEFDQAAWYKSESTGTKKLTIKALQRMPSFERKFSWEK